MTTAAGPAHTWVANPKQKQVLDFIRKVPPEDYFLVGYGGAAGGAKTNLIANIAWNIALTVPGSRTLIGRNELIHLRTTTMEEFDKATPLGPEVKRYDSAPFRRTVRLPDWPKDLTSTVYFQAVKDAYNSIGSEEFGVILLDEAHDIVENDIKYLFSRLRHRPEKKRGMVICFNPFPCAATDWFMKDQGIPEDMLAIGRVSQTFVPARVADNPHLPENYEQMMYGTLDPYLRAILLDGTAAVVPNAVFETMQLPEVARNLRVLEEPNPDRPLERGSRADTVQYLRTGVGVDWGTTDKHQSAMVVASMDKSGLVWIRDAWMSPQGSSDELYDTADRFKEAYNVSFARYDASQGSLKDALSAHDTNYLSRYPEARRGLFRDVDKGIRDVEGRIRIMRGLIEQNRVRFDWRKPGVQKLWEQMVSYHRDDKDKIVEEFDDLVDACLYCVYELEKPATDLPQGARLEYPSAPAKPGFRRV